MKSFRAFHQCSGVPLRQGLFHPLKHTMVWKSEDLGRPEGLCFAGLPFLGVCTEGSCWICWETQGKSWPTCIFVLEHGSCWIPDFHKERLRKVHQWCLRDIQMCLKKHCMQWRTWLLDDIIRGLLLILFLNKFFQYRPVSRKPPYTSHICFSPSSSVPGCASMQGHCWSWEWHELWYLEAQLRSSKSSCVWTVWNGVQLTFLDPWCVRKSHFTVQVSLLLCLSEEFLTFWWF